MSASILTDEDVAERTLSTWAYLTASLQTSQSEDVLDCMLPFVIAGIRQQKPGLPLDDNAVLRFLATIGLDLPEPVLTSLKPRLRERAILRVFSGADLVGRPGPRAAGLPDLNPSLKEVEKALRQFAASYFNELKPPCAANWKAALINVLKSETTLAQVVQGVKATVVGNDIDSDAPAFERLIVGRFVEHCAARRDESGVYDILLQVFSGLKILDFIRDIQIFSVSGKVSLQVYYDTSIVMRLLGMSGELIQQATERMHRSLQKIGCKTRYLALTKTEVQTSLERTINNPSLAHPETRNAFSTDGEITKFVTGLDVTFAAKLYDDFQIGEFTFSETTEIKKWSLRSAERERLRSVLSAEGGESYGLKTIDNDVKVISDVIALRRGTVTDDLTDAGHVFISTNPLLQRSAKLICHTIDYYGGRKALFVPPVMLAGQMASLAWLTAEQPVQQTEEISQELLVICFNAVRPSREWMTRFEEVYEKFKTKRPDLIGKLSKGDVLKRTIRSFMQDLSRNQPQRIAERSFDEAVEAAERLAREREEALKAAQDAAKVAQDAAAALTAENERLKRELEEREAKERERLDREAVDRERAEAEREEQRRQLEAAQRDAAKRQHDQLERLAPTQRLVTDAENQTDPANAASAERWRVAERMTFLTLVLLLLGGDLYVSLQNQWLFLGFPIIFIAAPPLFGLVAHGHRLRASEWLRAYALSVQTIPKLGGAFVAPPGSAHQPGDSDPGAAGEGGAGTEGTDPIGPDNPAKPQTPERAPAKPVRSAQRRQDNTVSRRTASH